VRVCGGGSVGTVEIGLVVGGEMQENLNKHLRKGKKVEAFSSKINHKAKPPLGLQFEAPLRGVRSYYYAAAALAAVVGYELC
jgi:hypothetical protein